MYPVTKEEWDVAYHTTFHDVALHAIAVDLGLTDSELTKLLLGKDSFVDDGFWTRLIHYSELANVLRYKKGKINGSL